MIIHLAGADITVNGRLRQRCSWCGAVLIDLDLTRVSRTIEDAHLPFPRWEQGALVAVDEGARWIVERVQSCEDPTVFKIPGDSCMELPAELTGAEML